MKPQAEKRSISKPSILAEIIQKAQWLHQRHFLAACDGNISFKITEDKILITPSGVPKSLLKSDDLAVVKLDGSIVSGHPSSEVQMHLSVYQSCPKANSVIHAHPPVATAWSIARPDLEELPSGCISELILACGSIPIVPFAMPGSKEMGTNLLPYVKKHRILILARHGALTWGEDLQEAYNGMERLEHTAQVLSAAESLGGLTYLEPSQIEALQLLRQKIGEKIL